jgi:ABC-2 type transport system permease protein
VNSLRVFFYGGLTSFRALFGWLSPWIYIPSLLVAPVFQILLFAFIGRQTHTNSDEFYVVGNGFQYCAIPCIFAMGHAIEGERWQQTLGYVLVTPAKRVPLFLGRSLPVIVNGAFSVAFALVVGGLILGISVPAGSILPIALTILVTAASCTGLGLTIAAIGFLVRETATLNNIVFGLLLVFCGVNVDIHDPSYPGWMATIAHGLPLTHGIEAGRKLADGAPLSSVWGLIGAEALIGGIFALLGYGLIRALEGLGRRRATLERA